ncbi:hypothetical protein, partial [Stella sp.]|uniref:hypothetical protein n=1 Tax=Stella sp. TaxID=2912054 RepID=UPI0035B31D23
PSHFRPRGHSLRRVGTPPLCFAGAAEPVTLLDDPDPESGKWIESVWRAPDGRLYGWCHRERWAPCPSRVMIYGVGALVSDDDGRTWRHLGILLEPRAEEIDCTFDNGWFAGGYGDFTVVPDPSGTHFLLHLTSYHAADERQGIIVARYPIAARDRPTDAVEWWTAAGWRPRHAAPPLPLVRPRRGWRHPDPDAHWGPAVHRNGDAGCWVMLLNHTWAGHYDLVQRGIAVAFSRDPGDPAGWSPPRPLIDGGIWYPQAVAPAGSDREGSGALRFFVSGFSLWEIRFRPGPAPQGTAIARATITEAEIARHFGPRRPDGGFGA